MKRLSWLRSFVCIAATLSIGGTETTHRSLQSTFADFENGSAENVSIRSDGRLLLGPRLKQLYEAPSSYLWDLALGPDGAVYVAAGPDAKVFRIGPDGRKSVLFETDAVEIHALAVDPAGNVYAATSPDAKVFKIGPSGGYSQFYDPGETYVWDLALAADGTLYLATGEGGAIHRVSPDGSGEIFYRTGETHVRSLAIDSKGDLIAGCDPSGLILRVSEEGGEARGFVLYESPKKEITALTLGPDDSIYAAGVGIRVAAPAAPAQQQASPSGGPERAASQPTAALTQQTSSQPAQAPSTIATGVRGGSSVVRLAPDGGPLVIWEDSSEIVYSLAVDPDGKLWLGTGDRGRVVRIDSEQLWTVVTSLPSSQVTSLVARPRGGVLAATSNIGKVYALGPELAEKGTFESDIIDGELFSRWGRLEADGAAQGVKLSARSGNRGRASRYWSEWSDGVELPAARYAQWRAELSGGADAVLDSVSLYYRPVNVAPRITALEATPPNYRFPTHVSTASVRSITLPPLGSTPPRRVQTVSTGQAMTPEPGYVGVRWEAVDPNDDELTARVELRGEGEDVWILIEDEVEDSYLSWDSNTFADGRYRARVTVSDRLANPESEAQSASRITEPFLIDNSAPAIDGLAARIEGGRVHIAFSASDSASKIELAEYSIDGEDWKPALPTTGLFDSSNLSFDFAASQVDGAGHTVAVRVADERENQTVAKTVLR